MQKAYHFREQNNTNWYLEHFKVCWWLIGTYLEPLRSIETSLEGYIVTYLEGYIVTYLEPSRLYCYLPGTFLEPSRLYCYLPGTFLERNKSTMYVTDGSRLVPKGLYLGAF